MLCMLIIEIGNKLLEKGYTVVFPSREMADMALTGAFERYKMNAVYAHKTEKNTLIVEYDKSDNGIPVLLGFIRGSKFKRNSNICYVPVSAYESLEELSEANNFAWSKSASERLETYKQSLIIANPVHVDSDSAVKPTRKEFDLLIIANPVHVDSDSAVKPTRKEFDLSDLNDD